MIQIAIRATFAPAAPNPPDFRGSQAQQAQVQDFQYNIKTEATGFFTDITGPRCTMLANNPVAASLTKYSKYNILAVPNRPPVPIDLNLSDKNSSLFAMIRSDIKNLSRKLAAMKKVLRLKTLAAVLAIALFTLYLTPPVLAANTEDVSHLLKNNWCVSFLWKQCDLSGADLQNANLQEANLSGANLSGANLSGANLKNADLSDADLGGANLANADIFGTDLSRSNLTEANLNRTRLWDANITLANLSGANLKDANLLDSRLWGSNLSKADLTDATLHGVDLQYANLADSNLTDTDLHSFFFRGSKQITNLSNANLEGANLTGANLRGALLAGTIMPDGSINEEIAVNFK